MSTPSHDRRPFGPSRQRVAEGTPGRLMHVGGAGPGRSAWVPIGGGPVAGPVGLGTMIDAWPGTTRGDLDPLHRRGVPLRRMLALSRGRKRPVTSRCHFAQPRPGGLMGIPAGVASSCAWAHAERGSSDGGTFHVEHRSGGSVSLDRTGPALAVPANVGPWPEGGLARGPCRRPVLEQPTGGTTREVVPRRPDSYPRVPRARDVQVVDRRSGPRRHRAGAPDSHGRARPLAGRMEVLGRRHSMRSVPADVVWAPRGPSANHLRSRPRSARPVDARRIPRRSTWNNPTPRAISAWLHGQVGHAAAFR